jgi:hypothetical protein
MTVFTIDMVYGTTVSYIMVAEWSPVGLSRQSYAVNVPGAEGWVGGCEQNGVDVYYNILLCREACQETQTIIWVGSHLVRAPYSRSGGHDSNPLCG